MSHEIPLNFKNADFTVLRIEPRTPDMQSKYSIAELHLVDAKFNIQFLEY